MLSIIGMNRFYCLRKFHDLRCKNSRVFSIIHQQLHREPKEDKGDFNGTLPGGNIPQAFGDMPDVPLEKQKRAYRKVMSYKRMKADKSICHGFGLSRLPEGTHASGDFLAHLAFNHFVLNVPYYREVYRLNDQCMSLSRITLINWLHKGAAFTSILDVYGCRDYVRTTLATSQYKFKTN